MSYIETWLKGLKLDYLVPLLNNHGITTPKKLSRLTVKDLHDIGVVKDEDRQKMFFLIQRLQTIIEQGGTAPDDEEDDSQPMRSAPSVERKSSIATSRPSGRGISIPREGNTPSQEYVEEEYYARPSSSRLSIARGSSGAPPSRLPGRAYRMESGHGGDGSENEYDHRGYRPRGRSCSVDPDRMDEDETDLATLRQQQSRVPVSSARTSMRSQESHLPARKPQHYEEPSDYAEDMMDEDIPDVDDYRSAPPAAAPIPSSRSRPSISASRGRPEAAGKVPIVSSGRDVKSMHAVGRAPPLNDYEQDDYYESDTYPDAHYGGPREPTPTRRHEVSSVRQNVPPAQSNWSYEDQDDAPIVADMPIRVVVRKRPLSRSEIGRGAQDILEIPRGPHAGVVHVHEPKTKVDLTRVVETSTFYYDDAFEADETNEKIYARTIRPLVNFILDGGKATVFAYGQTGSGKTFSMMGANPSAPAEVRVNAGLYVLAMRDLYSMLDRKGLGHLVVLVSCFEIYGGKLFDLLNSRSIVRCMEDAKQQVQLLGLSEHRAANVDELLAMMSRAHEQRSTGSTAANAESSRSHQVLQIVLRDPSQQRRKAPGQGINANRPGGFHRINPSAEAAAAAASSSIIDRKLSFIDLAGSERGADTAHASKQTRLEGAEINTSLLALKEVIRSLEKKNGFTPFRGSKLTQVLKDSFVGERTRTCMLACVSPSHANSEHTLNTLRYADRVKEHQQARRPETANAAAAAPSAGLSSIPTSVPLESNRPITAGDANARRRNEPPRPGSAQRPLPPNPPMSAGGGVPKRAGSAMVSGSALEEARAAPRVASRPQSSHMPDSSRNAGYSSHDRHHDGYHQRDYEPQYQQHREPMRASYDDSIMDIDNETELLVESAANLQQRRMSRQMKSENVSKNDALGSTALLEQVRDVVAAHKNCIHEIVEIMKAEMEMVQEMESGDNRDTDKYIAQLEDCLNVKEQTIEMLLQNLSQFQASRADKVNKYPASLYRRS